MVKHKNPSCWRGGAFVPACAGHRKGKRRGAKKSRASAGRCKFGKLKHPHGRFHCKKRR